MSFDVSDQSEDEARDAAEARDNAAAAQDSSANAPDLPYSLQGHAGLARVADDLASEPESTRATASSTAPGADNNSSEPAGARRRRRRKKKNIPIG